MAEADPERMMADTEAWKNRHLNVNEFELRKPLYSINTYTDTQVRRDSIYPPVATFSAESKAARSFGPSPYLKQHLSPRPVFPSLH